MSQATSHTCTEDERNSRPRGFLFKRARSRSLFQTCCVLTCGSVAPTTAVSLFICRHAGPAFSTHTHTHTHKHTLSHAHTHSLSHTHIHTCTHKHAHTAHTLSHAHTHTHTHAHTRTYNTHTHTHTHKHTHTLLSSHCTSSSQISDSAT